MSAVDVVAVEDLEALLGDDVLCDADDDAHRDPCAIVATGRLLITCESLGMNICRVLVEVIACSRWRPCPACGRPNVACWVVIPL